MAKKCSISRRSAGSSPSIDASDPNVGSFTGTQTILASSPFSSSIQNTPMARARMRQPGNVGSVSTTSASSGSPSSASVPGKYP